MLIIVIYIIIIIIIVNIAIFMTNESFIAIEAYYHTSVCDQLNRT